MVIRRINQPSWLPGSPPTLRSSRALIVQAGKSLRLFIRVVTAALDGELLVKKLVQLGAGLSLPRQIPIIPKLRSQTANMCISGVW